MLHAVEEDDWLRGKTEMVHKEANAGIVPYCCAVDSDIHQQTLLSI